eukprot:TRINITY_DN47058_c0_g1_i1.p2 TRINITY_DN47058_c0_g1~~TRINITY_DN47058_c0_g1_i1.p2  ORF type:complete len:134 (+),score=33.82 TRINITY_DN47058_c0_g1_i1:73-474(+)
MASADVASRVNEPKEVVVTWPDQQMICTFGRLNARYLELQTEIADKKKDIDHLDTAILEAMGAPSEPGAVMLAVASSFLHMDDVTEVLEKKMSEAQAELANLESLLETIKDRMATMKALLKAKFGQSIYLEND